MKQTTNEKTISPLTIAVITLAIVGTIADMFRRIYFGGGCLLKDIFDIPCPSCGMSRAFLSLLLGDIKAALHFHPLFWIFPVTVGLGLPAALDKTKKRKATLCGVAFFHSFRFFDKRRRKSLCLICYNFCAKGEWYGKKNRNHKRKRRRR
jgi:hypothetical protein